MQLINGKKLVIAVVIIITLQPMYLCAQRFQNIDNLFSVLDTAFNEEEPATKDEYYIGRAVAANILAVYKPYTVSPELTKYVNLICQALVINSNYSAVYNGYHVMVLDSREINAFSTPGGHIFITKGLIDIVPSEDALAGIIAHELAHIMLKHGMKMIDDMKIVSQADEMAGRAAAFSGNENARIVSFRNAVNGYFDAMIKSGYSQPQEIEADTLAVKLLAVTGYDPRGLLEILNILKTVQSGGINNTHPSPAQRIVNLQGQIAGFKTADNGSSRKERFFRIMSREVR